MIPKTQLPWTNTDCNWFKLVIAMNLYNINQS